MISIFQSQTGLFPKNLGPPLRPPVRLNDNFHNLSLYLQSYPSHYRALLGNFHPNSEDYQQILLWMKDGVLYAGSDGSVEAAFGAHSFCFTNGHQQSIIIGGAAQTPGSMDEITSLRAELAGAICLVLIIHAIQRVSGLQFPMVTIWIDNAEVLRRVSNSEMHQTWQDSMALDFDL